MSTNDADEDAELLKVVMTKGGVVTMDFAGRHTKKRVNDIQSLALVVFNTTMSLALIPGKILEHSTDEETVKRLFGEQRGNR